MEVGEMEVEGGRRRERVDVTHLDILGGNRLFNKRAEHLGILFLIQVCKEKIVLQSVF